MCSKPIARHVISLLFGFLILWASDYCGLSKPDDPAISEVSVHADRMLGGSRNIEEVSRCLYGPAQCVTVHKNLAYIGAGGALLIIDVSNPASPDTVGTIYTPGIFSGIDYQDSIVYAADGPAGIISIDVSNPSQPEILDILDIDGWAVELDIQDDYAYLATSNGPIVDTGGVCGGDLKIIDISDPYDLNQVHEFNLDLICRDIMVQGDYAYLCGGGAPQQHWWIINIADYSITYHHGQYQTGEIFNGVYISDTLFYMISKTERSILYIYNVSDPYSPSLLSFFSYGPGSGRDIQIKKSFLHYHPYPIRGSIKKIAQPLYKTYAYIADDMYGMTIIDVTRPSNPVKISLFEPVGFEGMTWMQKLYVKGKYAYAVGDWLWITDVSKPSNPSLAGYFDTGNIAGEIYGPGELIPPADDLCAIAYYRNGLQLVNVSYPPLPFPLGKICWSGYECKDVHLSASFAYATVPPYLKVCDIRNPYAPIEEIGSLLPFTPLSYLYYLGNHVYANGSEYFRIIDVSVPEDPWVAGDYQIGTDITGREVFVLDSIAYVLAKPFQETTGLFIFNIEDPYQPQLLTFCNLDGVGNDLFVKDGFAYVAEDRDSAYLSIIDVHNLADPQIVAELNVESILARGCFVYNDFCYIACWDGLKIIDILDPENPLVIDSYYTPIIAEDVHCARDYIYLSVNRCGLYILRYNPPSRP